MSEKLDAQKVLDNITSVVTNKRSRSVIFLIITFFLILLANGVLPLISGQAHYTADPVEVTYGEYLAMKETDPLIDLTYGAKALITVYKELYIIAHPELTPAEQILLEPPADLKVNIYTEFFFESEWWWMNTGIAILSAVFLFYAMFNYLLVRAKDTHVDHINGEYTMRQLNERYLDPDTFEPWMDNVFNKERKRRQHVRNIKYLLKKLEVETPYSVRRRFKNYFKEVPPNPDSDFLPVVYTPLKGKEKRYIDRKEELLGQLEPEYIEQFVVDNAVPNFKEIKPGFIYSGINYDGVGQDEYSTIKTDQQRVQGTMVSKLLVAVATTFAFASMLTVLAVNIEEQSPAWLAMTILMKIVPLFLQIYFAVDYANWFMENQLLPNLKFRENIAMLYLADMKRHNLLAGPVVINRIDIQTQKGGKPRETKN